MLCLFEEVAMWPHKDLGWWGFVLSLVALFLLYPVGVIVNITTPKLQNWWAGAVGSDYAEEDRKPGKATCRL
jgi:hypothetical protein